MIFLFNCTPIPRRIFIFIILNMILLTSPHAQPSLLPLASNNIFEQVLIQKELLYEKKCKGSSLNECSKSAYEEAKKEAVNQAIDEYLTNIILKNGTEKWTKNMLLPYVKGVILEKPKYFEDDWLNDSFKLKIRVSVDINFKGTEPVSLPALLSVTIEPQEATQLGAKWKIMGGENWQNSGDEISVPPGNNLVIIFKEIQQWNPPERKTVQAQLGEPNQVIAVYSPKSLEELLD